MPTSASLDDTAADGALADKIRAERVRFAFIQSFLPTLFSPLAAATLSLTLRDAVERHLLVTWIGVMLLIAVLRIALVRSYPAVDPPPQAVRRWELVFVASIVLVDLSWSLGSLYLMPAEPELQAVVFAFVMLMVGGHASSFAAHPATVVLGVLALALPITIDFALSGDIRHMALAFAATMYLAAIFRSVHTLGFFFSRTHRLAHALQLEKERAERLARLDFLTEMNNRRAFCDTGAHMLRLAERHAHATTLLMLDIDHFKAINDTHGHAAGDAAIRRVADLIRATNRDTDVAGRLGGEEFAVLLPETGQDAALVIAERLRQAIADQTLQHAAIDIRFTASIGVAQAAAGESLEALMARADAALYDAKHAGRNRVVAAPPAES